jgi:hypothetical protein
MFIVFDILYKSNGVERIEMAVSSAKEAVTTICLLYDHPRVKAFKMSQFSPSDLGMGPNENYEKYRKDSFTQQDYRD